MYSPTRFSHQMVGIHILRLIIALADLVDMAAAEAIFFEVKSIKNAVNLPTLNNFNNFIKNQQLTGQHFGNVELVGPASGFGSTSFNCQVVQGLKLGVKHNKL